MPTHLLTRAPERKRPQLVLRDGIALSRARAHEVCGPARWTFALWLAGHSTGPVLWIAPGWERAALNPDGMAEWADPGRFLFVHPRRAQDLLWCAEEALRAGAAPLVVTELPAPPALTPVRRLHLAAETGAGAERGTAPLGLLLTPGNGGAQGIESRWHMAPAHADAARRWRLERRRARTAPPGAWTLAPGRDGLDAIRHEGHGEHGGHGEHAGG
ncbi:ImuA family protein [Antarcticimicrobium luteum]|uniref:Protein ImuA n=1 Tax=Antarcticimicrobium luteum TaxID=2547397 RepID=A0A4R5V9I1_9RHOB|nr:hypothetical protein [Antarcticimicrobium luteum]TDK48750.1 hypothetical protein E1832_09880 [Antarcticimicrobium luteum]